MTPEPLTTVDKLQIMERLCGSMMKHDAQQLLSGRSIVYDSNFAPHTQESWLARYWPSRTKHEELYRHKNGGVYRKLFEATATEAKHVNGKLEIDDTVIIDTFIVPEHAVVVYEYIWPHEQGARYVRPKAEFEEPGRFVRIIE